MPTINARALSSTDAEQYRLVRLQGLNEHPPAFGSLPEEEPDLATIATRLVESSDRCYFGTFQDQSLIGIIRICRYEATNEKHRAYLAGLYVLPEFRRKGCGRSLVRQAVHWAVNAHNIRRINLTVVTHQQAAIALYQALGFQIYGTELETFSKTGQFYDEHLMTLAISLKNPQNL